MSGRRLIIGFLAFTAIFAGVLWYAQNYAFYTDFTAQDVIIDGQRYEVTAFQGIDASSSPLKLRACFQLDQAPEAPLAPKPAPLVAPDWFDCFDAEAIARALETGAATAYLAALEDADGADRIIARYPDGRAYMWRQLNAKFAD